MSHLNLHFQKRKSLDDFLSESLPNQILLATVKENTNLPDETILDAFNEAYEISLEVLDAPEVHIARSESFESMTDGIARSTLVSLCFVYFLLSFHREALRLHCYLLNLKNLLDKRVLDVFHPIYIASTSMSSLIPGSCSFGQPSLQNFASQFYNPRQFVSIRHVMHKAEELSNEKAVIVLQTLLAAVTEESGDWTQILGFEIQRILSRPEPSRLCSPYRIGKGHITDFVKIMRAGFELHIFEIENGLYVSNFENFIISLGHFFNTEIKYPCNLLSSAKSNGFLKIFDNLKIAAEHVLTKGDSLEEQKRRNASHNRQREIETELF